MYVKVCGITRPADAIKAAAAGADAIGILLFTPSLRSVTPRRAETILKAVSGKVETVCVTTTRSPAHLHEICRLQPDALQVYHDLRIPDRFITISSWDGKASPPEGADRLILDASHGRGIQLDIDSAKAAIARTSLPVLVSGGLTPVTVGEVMRTLHPAGVDVATGVERQPGVKDHQLVEAFISACRGVSL